MERKFLTKERLVGKQVIDLKAMVVGSVKDLSFDLEAKEIALTLTTKSGGDVTVMSSDITTVGDVILLNKAVDLPTPPEPTPAPSEVKPTPTPTAPVAPAPEAPTAPRREPGLCLVCNFQNDPFSKFCIKCGTKVQ